jgi:C4-dicarboxylate-specific signal transduction histidine kinase
VVIWTTVSSIGRFDDTGLAVDARILQAQSVMLFVSVSAALLAALFAERRESEERLAHANMMLERERDNKLINVQAVTASIAHEVRQPLAAIVTSADTALRFLAMPSSDHERVRAALNRIKSDGHRANEVFGSIRVLFGKANQPRQSVNVNEIITGVLSSLRGELQDHDVHTVPDLAPGLPLVDGHRGQLQEVILNLVHNAVEAMETTNRRRRFLWARTELRGTEAIVVSVKDSGPGIDPKKLGDIFEAFVTTKSHGMGLGLAICRMIVEQHGGQLTASSDGNTGAMFQFTMPFACGNALY